MIVSHVAGGLGNQLFMWSFGRVVAERLGVDFGVDVANFSRFGGDYALHKYVLDRLRINPRIVKPEELDTFSIRMRADEKRLRYNAGIVQAIPDNCYLNFYAADYRYTEAKIHKIRAELTPLIALEGKNAQLEQEMASCDSISLHVRLKDYVTNPHCLLLPIGYFRNAVKYVWDRVSDPKVYLFTDDPEMVAKGNFRLGYPFTLIDWNDADHNVEDMTLMSACKHHVIANSSFSFWAAWLDGKHGITVAPSLYHRPDCKQLLDTYGEVAQPEYPHSWIII